MKTFTFSRALLLLSCLWLLGSGSELRAQNFLEVPVKLEVEKGDLDGLIVKVKKNGKDAFTQSGASKMRFKLDFNKKYTLIFSKPGYISKTIEFNTTAPAGRSSQGFEPYKIGVKLFPQNEGENVVMYNQAVGRISYDKTIDEFNFETDYTKSILSSLPEEKEKEKEAEKDKEPEPEPTPESTTKEEPPATASVGEQIAPVGHDENPNPPKSSGNAEEIRSGASAGADQPGSNRGSGAADPAPDKKSGTGDDAPAGNRNGGGNGMPPAEKGAGAADRPGPEKKARAGQENQYPVIQARAAEENNGGIQNSSSGSDISGSLPVFTEEEKITREDIVEPNRIITIVRVIKGNSITEYSRVNYSWGGLFYFKDKSMSITENQFTRSTGLRP